MWLVTFLATASRRAQAAITIVYRLYGEGRFLPCRRWKATLQSIARIETFDTRQLHAVRNVATDCRTILSSGLGA